MQPIRGEMRAMGTPVNGLPQSSKPTPSTAVSAQIAVHEFHNSIGHALIQNCNLQSTFSKFEPSPAATDDSLDEMISSIPSFPELIQCHWDLTDGTQVSGDEGLPFEGPYDESPLLAAWFRQQQIISEGSLVGIQTMLPISAQLPEGAWIPQHSFGGSPPQAAPFYSTSAGANSRAARVVAPRKRVRARRGQATDPHSIAERRLRRDRIAEGMKALQELVPNANKTNKASDKASMLDEIINYVKFLQMQLKVFRPASPLIADVPSQGRGSPAAASETIAGMKNLVAKLMEEDMGSAMQYLQGKGFCLMPISLVSTLSTATSSSAARRVVSGISTGGDALP